MNTSPTQTPDELDAELAEVGMTRAELDAILAEVAIPITADELDALISTEPVTGLPADLERARIEEQAAEIRALVATLSPVLAARILTLQVEEVAGHPLANPYQPAEALQELKRQLTGNLVFDMLAFDKAELARLQQQLKLADLHQQVTALRAAGSNPPVAPLPAPEQVILDAIAPLTPAQAALVIASITNDQVPIDDLTKDVLYDVLALTATLQGVPAALDELNFHLHGLDH